MLEENVLYTYWEIRNFLLSNRKSEIRMYINVPHRKKERALMFDDGDKYYSINVTDHTVHQRGLPLTKCIFNEGGGFMLPKVIDDENLT